jgi:hypothetical protein
MRAFGHKIARGLYQELIKFFCRRTVRERQVLLDLLLVGIDEVV